VPFYAELVTLLTKSDIRPYQDFWVLSTGPSNPYVNLCPKPRSRARYAGLLRWAYDRGIVADDNDIVVPPRGDRIYYYLNDRVQPQYAAWALRDLASSRWPRREWIRFLVISLIIWAPEFLGPASFSWSSFAIWIGAAVLFAALIPVRRHFARKRITNRPLPPAAGLQQVRTQRVTEETQPDPMQSFYAKRR
jgi:hypothetical protein